MINVIIPGTRLIPRGQPAIQPLCNRGSARDGDISEPLCSGKGTAGDADKELMSNR